MRQSFALELPELKSAMVKLWLTKHFGMHFFDTICPNIAFAGPILILFDLFSIS